MGTSATNTTSVSEPPSIEIKRDGNNQEYVETCGNWVRGTLVMFDGVPHIRLQEHHEAGGGRLHLGPLVPLHEWLAFKSSIDTLVGPYIREPKASLTRSTVLDNAILRVIASVGRSRQGSIGGWGNLVQEHLSQPAEHADLLFSFKRLWKRRILRLTKPEGGEYSGNPGDDRWFFFVGSFNAELTPEGLGYWESIKD